MHYVPSEFHNVFGGEGIRPDVTRRAGEPGGLDPAAAGLFAMMAAVGLLLGGDALLALLPAEPWGSWRQVFGFRLALIGAVLGGARVLYRTLEGLLQGRVGTDLALTIACLAAILIGEPMVAGLVVFIALCGESLEQFTGQQARRAIAGLVTLRPATIRIQRDGREVELPADDVIPGDTVVVRAGERIPVDGVIVLGRSTIDESALTGESVPVERQEGERVFAGTLNQFGGLAIVAEQVGRDTVFGKVLSLMAAARAKKSRLERLADRFAQWFLPAVLAAAALTLLGWRWQTGTWRAGWMPSLAVLVVACPCPLVLATPSAALAALARLARSGVVLKGTAALERLAFVDLIAFDKTGTLTTPRFEIGRILGAPGIGEDDLLALAAAVERYSTHPLAAAVLREAAQRGLLPPVACETESRAGAGVTGRIPRSTLPAGLAGASPEDDGGAELASVVVGSRRLIDELGIEVGAELEAELDALEETTLLVAVDQRLAGAISLRSQARAGAQAALQALQTELGLERVLLTGDRKVPAERLAAQLGGFTEVHAEMLPADKAQWIEAKKRAGRRIAMVGDGINDAPALATADVGLAVGDVGSDLAAEAGDLVLLGDPIAALPPLVRLSRQTVQIIRQNLWLFAFGVNGVGVALSASGVLSPVLASLFHEAGSLGVMLNSLRLLWFEDWSKSRLRGVLESWGRWLDRAADLFSPGYWVSRALPQMRRIIKLTIASALGVWMLSNLVLIRGDEQAVVSRFGRFEASLPPGWWWRWPAPFERVVRTRAGEVRHVAVGYRSVAEAASGAAELESRSRVGMLAWLAPGTGRRSPGADPPTPDYRPALEWQADHRDDGQTPVPEESSMLSADGLPVEIFADVHYRIADLAAYLTGAVDPAETLRAAAERALREGCALRRIDEILVEGRVPLAASALERVRALTAGLGIEVEALHLLDVHPPVAVVPDYRQVADALEERERLINEAQTTYVRTLYAAAGEPALRRLGIDRPGRGDRLAPGADWWSRIAPADDPAQARISGTAANLLHDARRQSEVSVAAAQAETGRLVPLVEAYRGAASTTMTQIAWQAWERALAGRRLVLIDPQAAGRRTLWLGDPPVLGAPAGPPEAPLPLPPRLAPSDLPTEDAPEAPSVPEH